MELVSRAYTGQQQQWRRVDRAAAQHDLAGFEHAPRCLDADCPAITDPHAQRTGAGHDGQVRPCPGGRQIGSGRRPALTAGDREMITANALIRGRVEIVRQRVAGLGTRGYERVQQRMLRAARGHWQRAAAPVELGLTGLKALDPPKPGQRVLPRPAGQARLRPAIIVGRTATSPHHTVDAGRAADHAAPRPQAPPPTQTGFRLGMVEPVRVAAAEQHARHQRHPKERVAVAPSRFQQRDPAPPILAQPRRQHAPSRPGAHNHHIRTRRHLRGRPDVENLRAPRPAGVRPAGATPPWCHRTPGRPRPSPRSHSQNRGRYARSGARPASDRGRR